MEQHFTKQFQILSLEKTAELAQQLADLLEGGDTILLFGPVGSGKTHFVRSAIQHKLGQLKKLEDVPSPTFTLVQTYDLTSVEIWHADLYRLSGETEVFELGLDAAFETEICFVEWPERLGEMTPKNALRITFKIVSENQRSIIAQWQDPKWSAKLDGLEND